MGAGFKGAALAKIKDAGRRDLTIYFKIAFERLAEPEQDRFLEVLKIKRRDWNRWVSEGSFTTQDRIKQVAQSFGLDGLVFQEFEGLYDRWREEDA